jgi:plastocyanin
MHTKTALMFAAAAAATLILLLLAAAGAGDTGAPSLASVTDKPVKIKVQDNFFDPRSTSVGLDGRVVWIWKGSNRHNVVFTKVPAGASRRGARTRTDGRWKRSFGVPGLYRYVCRIYAGMRGTITVTKPPPPPPTAPSLRPAGGLEAGGQT